MELELEYDGGLVAEGGAEEEEIEEIEGMGVTGVTGVIGVLDGGVTGEDNGGGGVRAVKAFLFVGSVGSNRGLVIGALVGAGMAGAMAGMAGMDGILFERSVASSISAGGGRVIDGGAGGGGGGVGAWCCFIHSMAAEICD